MSIKNKKHSFYVLTIGENCVWGTLDAIKRETTIDYELIIFYACKNGINKEIYDRFLTYTDKIIATTKDYGWTCHAMFSQICDTADYIWIFCPDNKPLPGYVEKVELGFEIVPNVVTVGCPKDETKSGEIMISNMISMPDNLLVFSKDMINKIGGLCPSFRGYAHEIAEYHVRTLAQRFNFVTMKGISQEIGSGHEGRDTNKDLGRQLFEGWNLFNKARNMSEKGIPYQWWITNLGDM